MLFILKVELTGKQPTIIKHSLITTCSLSLCLLGCAYLKIPCPVPTTVSWGPSPQLSLNYSILPPKWSLAPLKYQTPVISSSPCWLSPTWFFSTPLITLNWLLITEKEAEELDGRKSSLWHVQCLGIPSWALSSSGTPAKTWSSFSLVKRCSCL